MKKYLLVITVLFCCLTSTAQNDEGDVSVKVDETSVITLGGTYSRTLQYNASSYSYRYYSDNTSIASVSYSSYKSCTVRGKSQGTCRVYFHADFYIDGFYRTFDLYWDVTVSGIGGTTVVNPTSFSIDPEKLTLDVGQEYQMGYKVYPVNATYTVEWVSRDKKIATVDVNTGKVKAIAPGETLIELWVFRSDGGNDAPKYCKLTVNSTGTKITSLKVSQESYSLIQGETAKINYTILPENATNKNLTFSCSDNTVARVDANGIITAVGPGDCNITLTTTDGSNLNAVCHVHVDKKSSTISETDISAINNVIYIENTEVNKGTEIELHLKMKNNAKIRGFQFDLYLPQGVTAVKNAKGRIISSLNNGRLENGDEHTLTVSEQADGAIRFLCGSPYDETFIGSDGEVATLTISISENIADGEYPMVLKNIKLTETDISNFYEIENVQSVLTVASYILGDINGDKNVDVSDYIGVANEILGKRPEGFIAAAADVDKSNSIDVSDYIGIANIILTGSIYGNSGSTSRSQMRKANTDYSAISNVIYIEPFDANAGEQVQIAVKMKNTAAIRGFQFDLYLPEGLTVAKNAKDRYICSLSSDRLPADDEHTLTTAEQSDGAIRFLCGSPYDETFMGSDGVIVTVTIDVAGNTLTGKYPVVLKNIKLTETDISKFYTTEMLETTANISGMSTGVNEAQLLNDNGGMINDSYYDLQGQRVDAQPKKKGVYIRGGKKFVR